MFHRIGTRGSTGGWAGDGMGSCVVTSLDGSMGGNGGKTGRALTVVFGVPMEG